MYDIIKKVLFLSSTRNNNPPIFKLIKFLEKLNFFMYKVFQSNKHIYTMTIYIYVINCYFIADGVI